MIATITPCCSTEFPSVILNVTSTPAVSANWLYNCAQLYVCCSQDCYIEVGPGATATDLAKCIGVPRITGLYIDVSHIPLGTPWRIAVVRLSTDGILGATPCNCRDM